VAVTEARELIQLLQSTVPAGTPVTISSEVRLLETLGVVSDEHAVSAMKVSSLLIPPDTPATFRGLMNLLTGLIRMNPKFGEENQEILDKAIAEAWKVDDFQLTFGTFLPICQKLLDAKEKGEPGRSQGT
jgi:hypothetical protein